MQVVPVHLTLMTGGGGTPSEGQVHVLVDALWAHAAPEVALEHVRAWAGTSRVEVVLFVRATGTDTAYVKAQRLLAAVLASGGTGVHGYSATLTADG
ncbi:hypothetical protein [Streptomyces sp. NPDC093225]|uniref:hypothetical protein n=1 Tax=Streptomyces sp. NPDC093225 TaxID=3366034 RepID=UPI00381F2FFF